MASYPPPYPPPGAPLGFDPRQQARLYKQQIRAQRQAQKAAFQAQRYAYRQQYRSLRRSSILGPVIVVAAGVVLLLIRTGRVPFDRFGAWYLHWWPMLLVGAGAVLLLEWAFDQIPRADGVPYVRRSMGGAGVVLFLVLLLTFAWVTTYSHAHDFLVDGLSLNADNVGEIFGEKHEITQQVDEDFPAGTALSLDDPHGDVTITGTSTDGRLHMMVNKQVWTNSDESADSKADRLSPRINLSGSTLYVELPSAQGSATDVSITMPESGGVTVNSNHGAVTISGVKAAVTITANHGDVELNAIGGAVNAHVNNRNSSFTGHGVAGDVTVRGHAQDVNLVDIAGQTTLEGEFFGETHLEHLLGPVSFRTSRTQFSLMKLAGEVDISPNSELTGNQIVGPTILRTSSRNIAFDRVAGNIDVTNSKGSVDLTSSAPLGNVTIENRDGAVNLTLPEHAGVVIDAETRGGEIENDLGLTATSQNERSSVRGSVGDGAAHVMVRTNHFDIEIHKGAVQPPAATAAPATPGLPAPAVVPSPPAKRKAPAQPARPVSST